MRKDYLEPRATRLLDRIRADDLKKNPRQAPREISRAIALEVLLRPDENVGWAQRLKGALDLGPERRSNSERFVVGVDREDSHYRCVGVSGDWAFGWRGKPRAEVEIRLVGRGTSYAEEVQTQIESLAGGAPWFRGAVQLLLKDGNASAKRVRASRRSEWTGQEIRGTEARMERSFVARRSGDGFPLAAWRIGYRVFLPAARTKESRDTVPVLQLDLLDFWGGEPRSAFLDAAFLCLFERIVIAAFRNIGTALSNGLDDDPWASADDVVPFALCVCLPPGMESKMGPLHAALVGLFDEDGFGEALNEANPFVQWIDVVTLDVPPGAIKAQEDAIAMEKEAAEEARKAAIRPGDEFMFVEIMVREFYIGRGGRYFPSSVIWARETVEEEFGGSAEHVLEDHGVDVAALTALDYDATDALLKDIAEVPDDDDYNDLYFDLWKATRAAKAGKLRPATGIRLLVLVDRATGAQAVELVRGGGTSEVARFLKRSTSIPNKGSIPSARPAAVNAEDIPDLDPGGLTLGTRPKHLLIARSLLNDRPEIAAWCRAGGVEIVHPKSGLGSMASIARVWHSDLESPPKCDDGEYLNGVTFSVLAQRMKELCWVLNEVPKLEDSHYRFVHGFYSGQRGADTELYHAWRDPLVAAAWNCG
mgnify:CR=1 FL=1